MKTLLFQPVDMASLAFFRIALGAILLWEVVRYFQFGWIDELYVAPLFHFTYHGFSWVEPLPAAGMYGLFLALGVLAILIAAGLYYRLVLGLFTFGLAYVFLLDKTTYLNHLYLVLCLLFLLVFLPAGRFFSIDAWRSPKRAAEAAPAYALWALRGQLAIVYFYGGLAKLNGDWLAGQPMQMWMSRMSHVRGVIPVFGDPWMVFLASYGAALFDLAVVPLLLWRRTRLAAFVVCVVFHLCNAIMFEIGIFPWFMICATTLFFSPDWPRRALARIWSLSRAGASASISAGPDVEVSQWHKIAVGMLAAWFALQLLLPLRHFLYPGNVDWTEEGSRFAWRMMLKDKACAVQFVLVDSRGRRPFNPRAYLTPKQIDKMSEDPEMLREFAAYLKRELAAANLGEYEVHVVALCSLNGRKPQLLVDPRVDLGAQPRTVLSKPWIVPLTEPLPEEPWLVPQSEWTKHVKVDF